MSSRNICRTFVIDAACLGNMQLIVSLFKWVCLQISINKNKQKIHISVTHLTCLQYAQFLITTCCLMGMIATGEYWKTVIARNLKHITNKTDTLPNYVSSGCRSEYTPALGIWSPWEYAFPWFNAVVGHQCSSRRGEQHSMQSPDALCIPHWFGSLS